MFLLTLHIKRGKGGHRLLRATHKSGDNVKLHSTLHVSSKQTFGHGYIYNLHDVACIYNIFIYTYTYIYMQK